MTCHVTRLSNGVARQKLNQYMLNSQLLQLSAASLLIKASGCLCFLLLLGEVASGAWPLELQSDCQGCHVDFLEERTASFPRISLFLLLWLLGNASLHWQRLRQCCSLVLSPDSCRRGIGQGRRRGFCAGVPKLVWRRAASD